MDSATLSIFIWGIYVTVMGMFFLFLPGRFLPSLGFAVPRETWIRVMGLFVITLGFYYFFAAIHDTTPFYWATVYGRFFTLAGFVGLVLTGTAKSRILTFGIIDGLGALWTLVSLLNE